MAKRINTYGQADAQFTKEETRAIQKATPLPDGWVEMKLGKTTFRMRVKRTLPSGEVETGPLTKKERRAWRGAKGLKLSETV